MPKVKVRIGLRENFHLVNRKLNNQRLITLCIMLCILLLSSCASTSHVRGRHRHKGNYAVASWYGKKFNGRRTASGERFNMHAMTCAHRSYKFGTKLRVTNPDNNKSVVVTVNDRGPFVRGRDIDLSYAAAKKIGIIRKGVGRVKIERIR
jgi:rare lipoprotein A